MEKSNVTPLVKKEKDIEEKESLVSALSPREIVSELDRFVVGQNKAKKAVAVALRNRWRRQALKGEMKNEVLPKNIFNRRIYFRGYICDCIYSIVRKFKFNIFSL